MKTLLFERNLPRFAAARLASTLGSGKGARVGPLRLVDTDPPELPGIGWHRVQPILSGICGSDLATLDGRSSRYFEDIVSFPFVPGHEVVGTLEDGAQLADSTIDAGARVVIEPVLGCHARAIEPRCRFCVNGPSGDCEHVAFGQLSAGLQTGFCADTGGGWSTAGLVAHHTQLHAVPHDLSDADAVTIEPVACAVHAALHGGVAAGDVVAIVGSGTLGLAVTAALSWLAQRSLMPEPDALLVGAKYSHQRHSAEELGATEALDPDQLARAVRRRSRSLSVGSPSSGHLRLTGGADVVFDCVGSAESIAQSLSMVRPRGRVVLVGMPGSVHVDLASLWHREVSLVGAYAYGLEHLDPGPDAHVRSFDLSMEVVRATHFGRFVSATYPLDRFEEAVAHAGAAGRRGAVKIAFDLAASSPRSEKGRA
jgi:threonine dehydrogenase-like Zn-dependent dehydrogenase